MFASSTYLNTETQRARRFFIILYSIYYLYDFPLLCLIFCFAAPSLLGSNLHKTIRFLCDLAKNTNYSDISEKIMLMIPSVSYIMKNFFHIL